MKKMSKYAAIIAIALAALVSNSCKNSQKGTPVSERIPTSAEEFERIYKEKSEAARVRYESLATAESRDSLLEAYYSDMKDFCGKVIAANPDKSFAIDALQTLETILSPEEFEQYINLLTGINKNHPYISDYRKTRQALAETAEGMMFKDFEADGVKFSKYIGKGKYVLVDFWGSWCTPCRKEIPNVKAVYEKYAGKDFDVLSVAVWDDPEKTKAAAKEEGICWNQMINAQDIPSTLYGITGIPHFILFGPDGTILKRGMRGAEIEAEVKKVLGI